jgi:hypothetical protein
MYSPGGEQPEWITNVCAGMTGKGCELFGSMYANALWNSSLANSSATASFSAIAEKFEDGSQIWKTEVTIGSTVLPVYILVRQNETENWLLERVLFTQEASKYEKP